MLTALLFRVTHLTFLDYLDDAGIVYKHECLFIEFIKFKFYASTKSWHTHQQIRLDELERQKSILEFAMEIFLELSIQLFEHLHLRPLFVGLEY